MQIKLNKINVDLNIDQIKRSQISFTALHGRRLNIQLADASWMKNISLNHLIEAVRTTAENQTQDSREIKDFFNLFNEMRHEGYAGLNPQIKKQNFLIQIITKVKHFFAEIKRNKLLKELAETMQEDCSPKKESSQDPLNDFKQALKTQTNFHQGEINQIQNDEVCYRLPKPVLQPNFESLPFDIQVQVLKKLDEQTLLALSQTNKTFNCFIKNNFSKELKKARYGKQALKEFLNYLKRPNFSSKGNYSFAENMVEILTPKFSKELICELNEFFLFNKDQPEGLYEFRLLIRIAKLAYKFHPAEVLELIKNTIQTMLSDRHEIKAGKELLILECIKFLAQIDLSNAVEYRNILQSKLNILIAQGFNLTFNSLDWALLETLAMIDPSILKSYENLLLNYSKKKLAIFFSILGTARSFENILDLVEKEQNESLKTTAIYMLLRRCHNEPIEPLQFIEETIDSYHSEDVLLEAAVAYARIGELEKALEIIDRIEDPYSQTTALIQIAEIYAPLDIQKTLQVLEKINLLDFSLDDEKVKIVEIYVSVDIEKAKEACSLIQDAHEKTKALCLVANAIKSQSQKEVEDLWENILQTAVQAKSSHVSQPYLSLLEVARQKAELDPNDAKQYFEDKLSNLPEQFTKKRFFMNALKEGKLGLEGGLGVEEFELLIEAYVKIDPSETEAWIRECQQDLPNLFLSKAFEALGKCL